MRIDVAEQQQGLKKHQACVPHCGSAAKQGEYEPREKWFDPEQEERADQRSSAEDSDHEIVSGPLQA